LYMGMRYPDAHKNGVSASSRMAPVLREIFAISSENFM